MSDASDVDVYRKFRLLLMYEKFPLTRTQQSKMQGIRPEELDLFALSPMHFAERKILLPCYQNLIAFSIKQTRRGRGCSDVARLIQSSKRAQPCAPFVIKFGRERVASVSGEGGSTEARQRGDRRRFEGERIESRSDPDASFWKVPSAE